MTNQNSKTSGGATSRPKDLEAPDSQPDHSATIKDIELNLLRELLKDGIGSGEDSYKALSEILQEINDRNRRYLLTFVVVAFLAIGILSFVGYLNVKSSIKSQDPDMVSQPLDMDKAELASLQETKKRIERPENEAMAQWAGLRKGEVETQEMGVIKDTERKITAEECTLHGTRISGKVVFYPRGEPKAYQPSERVCVLSDTYPWSCEKEGLLKYVGRKVFLSIAELDSGVYINFTVVGFFSPRDQSRMIQITMSSLENLLGAAKASEYIDKGVLEGQIILDKEAEIVARARREGPSGPEMPHSGTFAIILASFRQKQRADRYIEEQELKKLGVHAYIWKVNLPEKGRWNRVCVGDFPTLKEAKNYTKQLGQKGISYSFITKITESS